jgi:hypothetical protein
VAELLPFKGITSYTCSYKKSFFISNEGIFCRLYALIFEPFTRIVMIHTPHIAPLTADDAAPVPRASRPVKPVPPQDAPVARTAPSCDVAPA